MGNGIVDDLRSLDQYTDNHRVLGVAERAANYIVEGKSVAKLPGDQILHYESKDGVTILASLRPLVHCGECKHWEETDEVDGVRYGECLREHSAISVNVWPNAEWYCADGEKEAEHE